MMEAADLQNCAIRHRLFTGSRKFCLLEVDEFNRGVIQHQQQVMEHAVAVTLVKNVGDVAGTIVIGSSGLGGCGCRKQGVIYIDLH